MKRRSIVWWLLIPILMLSACESEETKGAKQLLAEAEVGFQEERYEDVLLALDSLHQTFPGALEQRQEALELARATRMAQSVRDSAYIQPLLQEALHHADSMYSAFVLVEAQGMPDENIIRYKGYNPAKQSAESSFLDIYIDSNGRLDLVAGTSATYSIGTQSLRISESESGTFVLSNTIPYDGGMNYRYENLGRHYERITFSEDRAAELAGFVASAPSGANVLVEFGLESGKRGPSFQLSRSAKEAIAQTYAYYTTLKSIEEMQLQLDRHEKRKALEREPK